jgi:hypothetical protein
VRRCLAGVGVQIFAVDMAHDSFNPCATIARTSLKISVSGLCVLNQKKRSRMFNGAGSFAE